LQAPFGEIKSARQEIYAIDFGKVEKYLFLGYAPTETSFDAPGLEEMKNALNDSKFQKLRREINEMKYKADQFLKKCEVECIIRKKEGQAENALLVPS